MGKHMRPERLVLTCDADETEDVEDKDKLIFSGPDDDGDLTVELDTHADAVTWTPKKVQQARDYFDRYLEKVKDLL